MHKIDFEHLEKEIPQGLFDLRVRGFPFNKDRPVLNFFLQGVTVFIAAAIFGFMLGHSFTVLCN